MNKNAIPPVVAGGKASKLLGGGSGGNNKGGAADDLASVVTGLKIATRLRAKAEQASQHVAADMAIRHLKKSLSQRNNDDNQHEEEEEDTRALVHQRRSGNARKLREGGEQHHQHNPLQSLWRSVIRKTDEGDSLPPQAGGGGPQPKARAPRRSVSEIEKRRDSLMASHTSNNFHSTPARMCPSTMLDKSDKSSELSEYGHADITKEMQQHPNDVKLLTIKCNQLRDIAGKQAESESLTEVIEVMRRFPNEKALQIACIGALWTLIVNGGDDFKVKIRNADGAQVILEAMECFPDDVTLLCLGLGAMSCLGEGIGGRTHLMKKGIIKIAESILKSFYNDDKMGKEVVYWVLVCLNALVSDYGDAQLSSEPKETRKALDISASSRSITSLQSDFSKDNQGWECESCSMLNTGTDGTVCELCGTERHSEQKKPNSAAVEEQKPPIDYNAVWKEEFNASETSRNATADSQILSLVLQAIQNVPMDGISLELALKFLCHFDLEHQINNDRALLIGACKKAIQAGPHSNFPLLYNLACTVLCLTMRIDEPDNEENTIARDFADVALDVLSYSEARHSSDIPQAPSRWSYATPSTAPSQPSYTTYSTATSAYSAATSAYSTATSAYSTIANGDDDNNNEEKTYDTIIQEVMMSLLANTLCFGFTKLKSAADYEELLDICCTALERESSSVFLHGTSCWVVLSILLFGPSEIKTSDFALDAVDDLLLILPKIESPTLLTVAFAAISEVAMFSDDVGTDQLGNITPLLTKYSTVDMLREEACNLLFNICKTKDDAIAIANTAILESVTKPFGDLTQQHHMAAQFHLLFKLSSFAGDDVLSLEDIETQVNASVQLKNDSIPAAKSWLGFVSSSITPDKEVSERSIPMAISSIIEIMESFPNNCDLQTMACMTLRNIAVSIQQLNLDIDISECIPLILNAQKEHGVQMHKDCCDALWALMGIQGVVLEPTLLREVVYYAIEVTEVHVVSPEYAFSDSVVSSGIAIMAEALSSPEVLGDVLVDIMVDVLNKCIYLYLDRGENKMPIPLVFKHAFCALRRLCDDDSCRDIIVCHGGIVAVCDGMFAHPANPSIQENGCHLLWRLGTDLATKLNIVEADGVDVILNVLITHSDNGDVLPEAFLALSSLSVDSASRNFIAQQGGIMLICNSMSTLADNSRVQETGLGALSDLTSSDVEESLIDGSNIFSVVHQSLNDHAKNESVQQKGLALSYSLSARSDAIRRKLLASGCLQNATQALQLHPTCSTVVSFAIGILINFISTEESTQNHMLEKEVIDAIIHAMMLNIEDLKVSIAGFNILKLICDKSTDIIVDFNMGIRGVEVVVLVMKVHHSTEYIQDTGCRILSRLSSQSFMTNGGNIDADFFDLTCALVDVTLSAMSGLHRNFQLQQYGVKVLKNMSEFEETKPVIYTEQSRIEEIFTNIEGRFPKLKGKCEEMLAAMS